MDRLTQDTIDAFIPKVRHVMGDFKTLRVDQYGSTKYYDVHCTGVSKCFDGISIDNSDGLELIIAYGSIIDFGANYTMYVFPGNGVSWNFS